MIGRFARILLLFGWAGVATAGPSPEMAEVLATIRAVGPEGRGNAEATAAWKELTACDTSALVPILGAMDGANDLAAGIGCGPQWMRSPVARFEFRRCSAPR